MAVKPPVAPTAFAAGWLVRALSATTRLDLDDDSAARLTEAGTPVILAYWHEQILLSAPFLRQRVAQGWLFSALASRSRDGELVARVAARFSISAVRGSSSRGGREGLRVLHREITRRRASLIVIPDGPRGPRREVKPGIVVLSQLSGRPIVPMAFSTARPVTLGSWDQMAVPKPGSRIRAVAGEPVQVPRELTDETREHYRAGLSSTLADLNDLADAR